MSKEEFKLRFSISATTRPPRGKEQDGKDYYFLQEKDFLERIQRGDFLEYEEVYKNCYYGSLKSEVQRIFQEGYNVAFDIDVKGGLSIKNYLGDQALTLFIKVPTLKELRKRLTLRGTEKQEFIENRLRKAEWEWSFEPQFDVSIPSTTVEETNERAYQVIKQFLQEGHKG